MPSTINFESAFQSVANASGSPHPRLDLQYFTTDANGRAFPMWARSVGLEYRRHAAISLDLFTVNAAVHSVAMSPTHVIAYGIDSGAATDYVVAFHRATGLVDWATTIVKTNRTTARVAANASGEIFVFIRYTTSPQGRVYYLNSDGTTIWSDTITTIGVGDYLSVDINSTHAAIGAYGSYIYELSSGSITASFVPPFGPSLGNQGVEFDSAGNLRQGIPSTTSSAALDWNSNTYYTGDHIVGCVDVDGDGVAGSVIAGTAIGTLTGWKPDDSRFVMVPNVSGPIDLRNSSGTLVRTVPRITSHLTPSPFDSHGTFWRCVNVAGGVHGAGDSADTEYVDIPRTCHVATINLAATYDSLGATGVCAVEGNGVVVGGNQSLLPGVLNHRTLL